MRSQLEAEQKKLEMEQVQQVLTQLDREKQIAIEGMRGQLSRDLALAQSMKHIHLPSGMLPDPKERRAFQEKQLALAQEAQAE